MNFPVEDAVLIYAKATQSRYGARALQRTKERMAQLASLGDKEGVEIYLKVISAISLLNESRFQNADEEPRILADP